ncbi:MAG: SGNH/GDSL hydrolase family protein [Anaerolineae bacterium]|nr:SGNH/GDSL hydrolase family protein [Anaerolineae bacterium]
MDNPTPPPPKRRWCLVIVVNVLVIVCLLEIGLRLLIGNALPPRFFEPSEKFGHFHVPGRSGVQKTDEYESDVVINDKGLRDDDVPYAKPDGEVRILVVGDSFVEGLQVEQDETFANQLEAQCSAAGGTTVTVINGGVSRFGTDNVVLFVEGEGLRYQPDIVIYAFYPNDVTDVLENDLFRLRDGELQAQPIHISNWEIWRGRLYDWSYVYRMGLVAYLKIQQQQDDTLIDTDWGLILPIYRAELHAREEGAWQIEQALLARLEQSVQAAGSRLMVVALPEIFQAEDAAWAKVESADEVLVRDAPQQRMATIMPPDAGYLDLLPDLQAAAQTTDYYYDGDGHFNPAGHQFTAQAIADYLTMQGWVDCGE